MEVPEGDVSWIKLFAQFGFPGLVCLWFMYRAEKRLEQIKEILLLTAGKRGVKHKEINSEEL